MSAPVPLRPRAGSTLAISAVLGAMVWALSPWLAGHREPWDAEGPFYVLALAVAGFVAGLIRARPPWAHYLGAVVGQLLYELLFLKIGPLAALGVLFLLGYGVVFALAAMVAGWLHRRLVPRTSHV